MAYYPAEETKIITAKTKEEMDAAVTGAMAEGFFPISDTAVWNAKLREPAVAYRQTMVKYKNTDPEFIAAMYAAFQPALDDIRAKLASIDSKLSTANGLLNDIKTNTATVSTMSNEVSTMSNEVKTTASTVNEIKTTVDSLPKPAAAN